VRDEGVGIPRENFEKIFDPYFTTKEKGTGLGLTIAFSIVNRHRGAVTIDSTVGRGATFCVYLPASEASAYRKEKGVPRVAVKGGKVLILDDDRYCADVN